MKFTLSALLFYFGLIPFSFSQGNQPCLPEGISFITQGQVDSFSMNYPGCNAILGDVNILGDDIQFLDGLSQITSVGGDLVVTFTSLLQRLEGFNALDSVYGDFALASNSGLQTLEALDSLRFVGGNITLLENPALESLVGLDSIEFANGSVEILYNDALGDLTGLALDSVLGDFLLFNNSLISDLTGLDSLHCVKGDFRLSANGFMTSLSGARNFHLVKGNVSIENHDNLHDFGDLRLDSILGFLSIGFNSGLQTLEGLDALHFIGGDLNVIQNASLDDFAGLDSLHTIGGHLNILNNVTMTGLSGLKALDSIRGNLTISGNSTLNDITGLDSLAFISGDYTVDGNPELQHLPFTNRLDSIGRNLIMSGNASLENLLGLDSLTAIGGDLTLINNENLTSLDGLDSLQSLNGAITFFNNVSLEDIQAIAQVRYQGISNLIIENAENLSECNVISICNYLAGNSLATISNNATGCNSREEVITSCLVSVQNPTDDPRILVYPNPTNDILMCSGEIELVKGVQLFDARGKCLRTWNATQTYFDFDAYAPGLYTLLFQLEDGPVTKRVIKL